MSLENYSFGMGDRFAHQGKAPLRACLLATNAGAGMVPGWDKSNREHLFIGIESPNLRAEAESAKRIRGRKKYDHVDASGIHLAHLDHPLEITRAEIERVVNPF